MRRDSRENSRRIRSSTRGGVQRTGRGSLIADLLCRRGIQAIYTTYIMFGGLAFCDEPQPTKAKEEATASDPKPAVDTSKTANDKEKEKKSTDEQKADAKKQLTRVMAKNQAAVEVMVSPLKILFGGPVDQAVLMAPQQAAAEVDDNNPMVQQYQQQLRPVMQGELEFVRMVCSDLTVEQRAKIKSAAEEGLKAAAKAMATPRMAVIQINGAAAVNPRTPAQSAITVLRTAIQQALEQSVSSDQAARFKQELEGRVNLRKNVAILVVVSAIDERMLLTVEQREKITRSLHNRWQEDWENWPAVLSMYGKRYLPTIPDDCVVQHLSADQQSVWQGIQKVNVSVAPGAGRMRIAIEDDNWWGAEPARPDKKARPARGAGGVGFD